MTRKVAIVTGGSSGIGRSICTALARRGWDVAFTYVRDIEGAEETRRLLIGSGSKVMAAECDAGVGQEVDAFHDAVTAWSGVPDLLEAVMDLKAGLIHPLLDEYLPQAVSV